jgi:serine/threonine protein kinase
MHEKDVIHRDMKPDNIFIQCDGSDGRTTTPTKGADGMTTCVGRVTAFVGDLGMAVEMQRVAGMLLNISVYIQSIFSLYSVYIQSIFSL